VFQGLHLCQSRQFKGFMNGPPDVGGGVTTRFFPGSGTTQQDNDGGMPY
jgi:hypothetical protein